VEARGPEQDHWNRIQGPFWREGGISPGLAHEDVLPRFREEAVSYLERQGREQDDNPFFLYLALPAPHTPWLPLEEYEGTSGAGMYGDFTVQVDDMVGDVMKALDRLDMAEDTLVIFTSDNGPTWYDKDVERWDHRSTGPYRGMKGGAWEGGHRMPFIARWPGHVPEGATSDQLLSFTDFMATFAAITGQELSANEAPDSENLLPAFLGEASEPLRQTFVVDAGGTVGLRVGDWKFIPHKLSTGFTPNPPKEERQELPPVQLYNLAEDPGEQNNLHDQEPDKLEEMKQTLQQIREQE
jgi:arylsulfatase A-like enzyme